MLNSLTEPLKLDGMIIRTNEYLLIIIFVQWMYLVIEAGHFMNLFDSLVDNYKTYLIVTLVEYLSIIEEICNSQESSIIIELNWLFACPKRDKLRKRIFLFFVTVFLKLKQILQLWVFGCHYMNSSFFHLLANYI